MKEIVFIGKDEVKEIDLKPITMVFKSPKLLEKIEYPDRMPLSPEVVRYHADRVERLHKDTPTLMKMVFKEVTEEITPEWGRRCDETRQVMGLIDMSLKLRDKCIPFVWITPEAGLHPAHCCELADVIIFLSGVAK